MTPGIFILSLDCEGKWGFADIIRRVRSASQLSSGSLESTYRTLLEMLDRHEVPATFAFVGLFASEPGLVLKHKELFESSPSHRRWMAEFWKDWEGKRLDGWFCPSAFEQVRAKKVHEIGTHGFTHLPFNYEGVVEADREFELAQSRRWALERGVEIATIIFPRNGVASLDLLRKHGIVGYRTCAVDGGAAMRLLNEFRMHAPSEPAPPAADPVAIPAGYFLNWRNGARALVPFSVSRRRFQHVIEHAARTGGIAHLWLHPHNLITGSRQFDLLEECLSTVGRLAKEGRLLVKTQAEYCRDLRGGADG